MKRLDRIAASTAMGSALAFAMVFAACTSTSGGGGGSSGGASSSGGTASSGGGTVGGVGACVLFLDDAGNEVDSGTPADCLASSVNGDNISGPPCANGLAYVTSCPSQGLLGCCTTKDNSASADTVLTAQCYYPDLGLSAAQLQAACTATDGGPGGTWSTTAP